MNKKFLLVFTTDKTCSYDKSLSIVFLLLLSLFLQANPIVIENKQEGTSNWRITKSSDDLRKQIKGYVNQSSVEAGDTISFHVSVNPAQKFRIEIYRLGYYDGKGGTLVYPVAKNEIVDKRGIYPFYGTKQNYPALKSGVHEFDWDIAWKFSVPLEWRSGVYVAKLQNEKGFENYIPFVVRDDRVADLIYVRPNLTSDAYNSFPAISRESLNLIIKNGVPKVIQNNFPDINFDTLVYSDLNKEDQKNIYRRFIKKIITKNSEFIGNSFYPANSNGKWGEFGNTVAKYLSLDRPFSGDGSGDLFKWEYHLLFWLEKEGYDVTYANNLDIHRDPESLLKYKVFISPAHDEYWTIEMFCAVENARDSGVNLAFFGANSAYWKIELSTSIQSSKPFRILSKDQKFRSYGLPEQTLVGVQFSVCCNGLAKFYPSNLSHWAFNNSGFVEGDFIPKLVGYEIDGLDTTYALPQMSNEYEIIASSPYVGKDGNTYLSQASIYQANSGAWVFGAGTMNWSWALGDKKIKGKSIYDERLSITTRNILNRMLKK